MKVLLPCCLLLSGCWDTRKDVTENVVHHDHFTVDGAVTLPGVGGPLPIHLNVEHDGSDVTTSHEEKKLTVDGAEIGRQIAGILGPLMSVGATASPWGIAGGIGSVVTALGAGYVAHKARQHGKGKLS